MQAFTYLIREWLSTLKKEIYVFPFSVYQENLPMHDLETVDKQLLARY